MQEDERNNAPMKAEVEEWEGRAFGQEQKGRRLFRVSCALGSWRGRVDALCITFCADAGLKSARNSASGHLTVTRNAEYERSVTKASGYEEE